MLSGWCGPPDTGRSLLIRTTAGNLSPITTWVFGVGAAVTAPGNGAQVTRLVRLAGKAPGALTSVSWKYKKSGDAAWNDIPATAVTQAGTALTAWPVTATVAGSGATATATAPDLVWDVAATVPDTTTTTVQVASCWTPAGGGTPVCVAGAGAPTVTVDRFNAGNTDATTDLAGGTLDLLTGNFTLDESDVTVGGASSDLNVTRSFVSQDPARTADPTSGTVSVFGPGWTTGLPVDSAGSDWTGLADRGTQVAVSDSAGAAVVFARTGTTYVATGLDAYSGLTLTAGAAGGNGRPLTFTVKDLDGNATTFSSSAPAASPTAAAPNRYAVSSVAQPGTAQTTSYAYNAAKAPIHILAPVPTGSVCTSTAIGSGTWTGACRGLQLTYATTGPAAGRLTAVTFRATTTAGAELDIDVACYAYDTAGRLAQVWDPRDRGVTTGTTSWPVKCTPAPSTTAGSLDRPTTYTYDGAGRVATITPAGLAPWTLTYEAGPVAVSAAKLVSVSRTHTVGCGGTGPSCTSETTGVVYGVPAAPDSTDARLRPDLTAAAVVTWGQREVPVTGTAVFGPGRPATGSDLRGAQVTYLNAEGRTVNTAEYSTAGLPADGPGSEAAGGGWRIATTDYDDRGNVVRTLDAGNREEALAQGGATPTADPALGLPTDTAAAATALSTVNVYAYTTLGFGAGSADLTDTFGPYHLTRITSGPSAGKVVGARAHTRITYDTGGELGHPAGGTLRVPITTTVGASLSTDTAATAETDVRTTTNAYALTAAEVGSGATSVDATGWTFRAPMKVTTDLSGSGGGGQSISTSISQVTRYDPATGAAVETRQPRSVGGDAAATVTVNYTSAANTADPQCGLKPAWAGLLCLSRPAAQPTTAGLAKLPVTTVAEYDYLTRPKSTVQTVVDAAGATSTRTTTTTYTTGGYGTDTATTTVTGTGTGIGAAVPVSSVTLDPATGLAVKVTAAATATQAATSSSTSYDDFGRVVSYTDNDQATGAQANTTTTVYDVTGKVASTTDAKGSTTYTYNEGGEWRDQATTVTISGVGAFTATYDGDGSLSAQTWPNGLTQTTTSDESGQTTAVVNAANGRTWLGEQTTTNIHGQTITSTYAGAGAYAGSRSYTYDLAGRLTRAQDTQTDPGGLSACTTRTYAFDADGNRTSQAVYNPAPGTGACQTTTAASSAAHTYDLADRLLPGATGTATAGDVGLVYDAFGRITTVPQADTGTPTLAGNATISYYLGDLVRSQAKAGVTHTYSLDASGRLAARTTTSTAGTAVVTHHYDDAGSDSPDWTSENATATTWTRYISDPAGNLAATFTHDGILTWQISNLHGDTVATAPATALEPATYTLVDEYGNTLPGYTTPDRYGPLGAKMREVAAATGLTLMGVRLYSPALGRFLSVDPVIGGNANSYTYPNDPVNSYDLDGQRSCRRWYCRALRWGSGSSRSARIFRGVCGWTPGALGAACAAYTSASYFYRGGRKSAEGRKWAINAAASFAGGAAVGRAFRSTHAFGNAMKAERRFPRHLKHGRFRSARHYATKRMTGYRSTAYVSSNLHGSAAGNAASYVYGQRYS